MSKREGVCLPTRLPQLIVDQQAGVRLVEDEIARRIRGRHDEVHALLGGRRRRGNPLLGFDRQRLVDRALFLCQPGAFLGRHPGIPRLLDLARVPFRGRLRIGQSGLQRCDRGLQLDAVIGFGSGRDEGDGQTELARSCRTPPDAEPMTELYRLQGVSTLAAGSAWLTRPGRSARKG